MLGTLAPGILLPLAQSAGGAAAGSPAAIGGGPVLAPVVILVMCLVAGVGTVMLLPSRRETPLRKIGGVVVLVAALILAALLIRAGAGVAGFGGMGIYFWAFSAIALLGALRVVTHTRPVYSALYFVLTVFATAGLFILLWAEFMAAALVLIYAGAILVTYVFVIMLATSSAAPAATTGASNAGTGADGNGNGHAGPGGDDDRAALAAVADHDAVSREPLVASAVGFVLMGILLFVIFDRATETVPRANRNAATGEVIEEGLLARSSAGGETQRLGVYLFENHFVNLELAGLLLTISMVGAIVIARRRIYTPAATGAGAGAAAGRGDVFTAPATPVDDNPHSIPVYGTDNPRQKAYPET